MRFCNRAMFIPAALVLAAGSTAAFGQTDVRWLNAVNGQWGTAANWDLNVVPNNNGTDYRAILDVAGPSYEVQLDSAITVSALQIVGTQSQLNLTSNTLTVVDDVDLLGGQLLGDSATGEITIGGVATIEGAFILGVSILSNGTLNIEGPDQTDLCDTGIDHAGVAANWTGSGSISMSSTSTFINRATSTFTISGTTTQTLIGTAGSLFTNEGILTKSTGTADTFFDGGTFENTGEVRVETGSFRTNGVDIVASGGVLETGTWRIEDGAALELVDAGGVNHQILTNQASVIVNGPAASFDALNTLATNDTTGELTFSGGTQFNTVGDFQNSGALTVGANSAFRVNAGSALTNVTGTTLADGTFEVLDGGVLAADNLAGLETIDTFVTLQGATADIQDGAGQSVLASLTTIGASGSVTLDERDVEVINDFTVANTGTLVVEAGTTFSVAAGSDLTNFSGGVLVDGNFTIRGEIIADNLDVQEIDNTITLDDADALFTNRTTGSDAFANLNLLSPAASLTVANGRDLTTLGSLTSLTGSTLTVGAAAGANTTVVTINGDFNSGGTLQLAGGSLVVTGNLNLTGVLAGNGTLNGQVVNNGEFNPGNSPGFAVINGGYQQGLAGSMTMEIGGLIQGVGYDCVLIDGDFSIEGGGVGGTLRIGLIDGFVPTDGDVFDILLFDRMIGGGFATIETFGSSGNGLLAVEYLSDRVRLVYHAVPTPGTLLVLVGAGVGAFRRRRGC